MSPASIVRNLGVSNENAFSIVRARDATDPILPGARPEIRNCPGSLLFLLNRDGLLFAVQGQLQDRDAWESQMFRE